MKVLLNDIVNFVQEAPTDSLLIPTVLLLTGVNLPDHGSLFNHLKSQLKNMATSNVAVLSSSDCLNIKHTVEFIVAQFVNKSEKLMKDKVNKQKRKGNYNNKVDSSDGMDEDEVLSESDVEMDIDRHSICEIQVDSDEDQDLSFTKKSDCTISYLSKWYAKKFCNPPTKRKSKLVIVFKDFEGFHQQILHNLILILSGYRDKLPIVLVFGVATTEAAVGESLTHQITSKLSLKVFQSQPSVYFLNNTLDKVFLTPDCPFQLSSKLLKFFTDVFLFYDFSVHQFTQGIKYCVMDHFFENDLVGLLCQEEKIVRNKLKVLNLEDLRSIESFSSFKKFIEDSKNSTTAVDGKVSKPEIMFMLTTLRRSIVEFYVCLSILHTLVKDLPQSPLGKQLRELYCLAMSKDISKTSEYKECQQFLNFSSKDDLERKLSEVQSIILKSNLPQHKEAKTTINNFKAELEQIELKTNIEIPVKSPMKIDLNVKNRSQLKQKLAEIGTRPQIKFGFEALRENIVNYFMNSFLPVGIPPYMERTQLWEAVLVQGIDARNRVVARIRAPIHTALNNPQHYLQCKCCEITDEKSILPTMPDICIAYKLHLEGGPQINIYDWLQSFSVIVDSEEKKTVGDVDEEVQARFTQAMAELEFLGFIKSSKSKPDHAARLTWGGTS